MFSADVLLTWLCLHTIAFKAVISVTLLINTGPVDSAHTLSTNFTSNSSAIPNNDWPPEPYTYRIPDSTLTIVCMSYRHGLSASDILFILRYSYEYASHKVAEVGPAAFIGRGCYGYNKPPVGVLVMHARSSRMCWSSYQEVILGLQQLVARLGAIEMVYLVNDGDHGSIAVGSFEALED